MDDREFLALNEELSIRYPGASAGDIWEITVMVARCVDRRRRKITRPARHAPPRGWGRSRSSRRALWGMAEGLCSMCGTFVPFEEMTVGHIIPRAWGGTWAWGNIQMECGPCNHGKGASYLPERGDGAVLGYAEMPLAN
jgi:5-methylcytosine-specific restriction endonuclease McrA